MASAGFDGQVRIWNLEEATLEREFTALPGLVGRKAED
jgi:hypothetical protein